MLHTIFYTFLQSLFIRNSITQFKSCSVQHKLFSFMLFPALSFFLTTARKIPSLCSEVSAHLNLFSLSTLLVFNYVNINVTMSCTLQALMCAIPVVRVTN